MASKLWIGTTGDWATAGNWSPSGVPINDDNVLFGESAQSVTSGLNQGAVTLDSLTISDKYTGSIGSATGYLNINADVLTYAGKGTSAYISGTFPKIDVNDAGGGANALHLDVTCTGKCTIAKGGTVTIDGSGGSVGGSVITELLALANRGQAATVVVAASATVTLLVANGASVTTNAAVTTIEIMSGELTHNLGNITTCRVRGGSVKWEAPGTTLTTLECYGGEFDASGDPTAKTIGDLHLFPAGSVRLDNGAKSIAISGKIHYRGEGRARMRLDTGRQLKLLSAAGV